MNPHETGYICFTDQGPVVSITGNINYAPILYPLPCGDQASHNQYLSAWCALH